MEEQNVPVRGASRCGAVTPATIDRATLNVNGRVRADTRYRSPQSSLPGVHTPRR